jgi:hypothetical protein
MADRVYPLKFETPGYGTQLDTTPTELDPNEDHIDVRGVFIQNNTSDDESVLWTRDSSDRMTFKDSENTTPLTLTQLASGALPPATAVGQVLASLDGSTFDLVSPLVSDLGGMLTNGDGHMVVQG